MTFTSTLSLEAKHCLSTLKNPHCPISQKIDCVTHLFEQLEKTQPLFLVKPELIDQILIKSIRLTKAHGEAQILRNLIYKFSPYCSRFCRDYTTALFYKYTDQYKQLSTFVEKLIAHPARFSLKEYESLLKLWVFSVRGSSTDFKVRMMRAKALYRNKSGKALSERTVIKWLRSCFCTSPHPSFDNNLSFAAQKVYNHSTYYLLPYRAPLPKKQALPSLPIIDPPRKSRVSLSLLEITPICIQDAQRSVTSFF